jgi:SAM-dependent methyltransferase
VDLSTVSNLTEVEPGLWAVADELGLVSYPDEGHHFSHAVAETSFWFKHRTACVLAAIDRFPPPGAVLDVGGGTGHLTAALQASGQAAVLVEPGGSGVRLAQSRGVRPVIHSTLDAAGFDSGTVPAVGLFDVVEHIEDDLGFLRDVRDLLVPGGRTYLTVPAGPWLWSNEDVHAGHYRRYVRSSLADVLEGAGLEVEYLTAFFRPLPLPIFLLRSLPSLLGVRSSEAKVTEREHATGEGVASKVLARLLAPEIEVVANGGAMRWGGSLLAVARRTPEG